VGRLSKFQPEAQATFLKHLRLGMCKKDAAAVAGWSEATLERYCVQGRQEAAEGRSTAKARFVAQVERAQADFKLAATAVIVNAANGSPAVFDSSGNLIRAERKSDWQAAAWLLEKRFPKDYGVRREVSGRDGGPIEVELTTAEHLVEKVRHLRAVPESSDTSHDNA
jgi:hypothetical protein